MNEIVFGGQSYRLADQPGVWPLMQFARAASNGLTVLDMESLAAIHALLQGCVDPDDWPRFEHNMIESKASIDELLDLSTEVVALVTEQARLHRAAASAANGQVSE